MPLQLLEQGSPTVTPIHEPVVFVHDQAQMSPRPGDGRWSAELVHAQLEGEPQWHTVGAGLGAPAGTGTDDAILWPLEPVRPEAGLTSLADAYIYTGSPSRISLAITQPVQMFEDVPEIISRRLFVLMNDDDPFNADRTVLEYQWANDTRTSIEFYAYKAIHSDFSEALACCVIDDTAETSVVLNFFQVQGTGEVYCTPVEVAREDRNGMAADKEGHDDNTAYPVFDMKPQQLIATGGLAGIRTGWTGLGYEGGDITFSSLQAVGLGNNRALLLRIQADTATHGTLYAQIITYSNGTVTAGTPVALGSGQMNLYQAVPAVWGKTGGTRTEVAVSTRNSSGGDVWTLDCSGTPTITGHATVATDYSHVAWVNDRVAVLTRNTYSATWDSDSNGTSTLGFADSPTDILLYDADDISAGVVGTIDADAGLLFPIQQTGVVHGFSDGRLFMGCSSFSVDYVQQNAHVQGPIGGGIRLFLVNGNSATLQDQIGDPDNIKSASTQAYRLGESVMTAGPTGETYGAPPGDEQAMFEFYFCGGVLKEGNSDVQPYRLTDNWLIVTEPEKNGIWYTHPTAVAGSGTWREVESLYVRAIHLTNGGVPDLVAEPLWLNLNVSWYSTFGPIDDTHFFITSVGYTDPVNRIEIANSSLADVSWYFQVIELDPTTGTLSIIYEEKDTHTIANSTIRNYWHTLRVGDTDRYLMIYNRLGDLQNFNLNDLWIRSFRLNSDYSATTLDDQLVSLAADAPGFGERKAYEMTALSDDEYVITWVIDNGDGGHWSAHRGAVVNQLGQITMGNILSADPESNDDGLYGFQGVWMHNGCAVGGRYVYPVGDEWPGSTRYPNITQFLAQRLPVAVVILSINGTTADLTVDGWYPLKVDPDDVDLDWYNHFFSPVPHDQFGSTDGYNATTDGGLYYFWETMQLHRGIRNNEFWAFQGPSPVPFISQGLADGMTMALWRIDDATDTCWFGGSWGQYEIPYHISYMNGSCEMRRGMIACVSTLEYYSRASPQGWSAGFGANRLRVWLAGPTRGAAGTGPQTITVYKDESRS